jgi:hypothetical protein
MPSIGSHLAGARLVADRLAHRAIESDRGAYFLGATAPDLRGMTRQPRDETHFFSFEELAHQDSAARMFSDHPRLGIARELDSETRAFIAGYLTHLLMDEQYIERVYREYFGQASRLAGDARADLLDRLLQYELDRRERMDDALRDARNAMAATSARADVAFIAADTLQRWRDVAVEMASHPATWDRWARTAARHASAATSDYEDEEAMLREVPDLLREVLDHVTEQRVREFMDESIEVATARVREYLG